jgi:hypothetical protein
MSGASVLIATFDSDDGSEREAVYFRDDGQRHVVEIASERRTVDGWVLRHRNLFALGHVHLLHDAIGRACAMAGAVRR